jgi:hypothetical protein
MSTESPRQYTTGGDGTHSVVYLQRTVAVPPAASSTVSVRP